MICYLGLFLVKCFRSSSAVGLWCVVEGELCLAGLWRRVGKGKDRPKAVWEGIEAAVFPCLGKAAVFRSSQGCDTLSSRTATVTNLWPMFGGWRGDREVNHAHFET